MISKFKIREISIEELKKALSDPCPCCGFFPDDSEAVPMSTDDFGFGYYHRKCLAKISKVNDNQHSIKLLTMLPMVHESY